MNVYNDFMDEDSNDDISCWATDLDNDIGRFSSSENEEAKSDQSSNSDMEDDGWQEDTLSLIHI